MPVETVLENHTEDLMSLPGVVAVGVGERSGRPCIRVYMESKAHLLTEKIPRRLDGYPVAIQQAGQFQALDEG